MNSLGAAMRPYQTFRDKLIDFLAGYIGWYLGNTGLLTVLYCMFYWMMPLLVPVCFLLPDWCVEPEDVKEPFIAIVYLLVYPLCAVAVLILSNFVAYVKLNNRRYWTAQGVKAAVLSPLAAFLGLLIAFVIVVSFRWALAQ